MLENHQRQELYRFFARIFTYPDPLLLDDLAGELSGAAHMLATDPPILHTVELEEIQTAYTELFISRYGGIPAPPYGSVYLEEERQLMGQTTQCVLQAYNGEGLSLECKGEPPDFIATEMEFLYFLVGQEISALAEGDIERGRASRQKQVDFCHTLLQPWVRPFCARVVAAEGVHPLYRWSADRLLDFCRYEEELHGVV